MKINNFFKKSLLLLLWDAVKMTPAGSSSVLIHSVFTSTVKSHIQLLHECLC